MLLRIKHYIYELNNGLSTAVVDLTQIDGWSHSNLLQTAPAPASSYSLRVTRTVSRAGVLHKMEPPMNAALACSCGVHTDIPMSSFDILLSSFYKRCAKPVNIVEPPDKTISCNYDLCWPQCCKASSTRWCTGVALLPDNAGWNSNSGHLKSGRSICAVVPSGKRQLLTNSCDLPTLSSALT